MSRQCSIHPRLRERGTRLFFRHFFRLLLVFVSVAEWACIAWPLQVAIGALPLRAHAAAILTLYLVNFLVLRWLPHSQPPGWQRGALRAYSAFAFTTIFGFAFLILNTAAWIVIAVLTQSASVAAGERTAAITVLPSVGYEWSSTIGVIGIGLLFLYGYTFGQHHLVVTRLRVPLPNIDGALVGLRVVQISDIHVGRYMPPDVLAGYVERVNALEPDILVITGDILDRVSAIAGGFPVLARLRARHGVFAVLGNHDVYAGADQATAGLRQLTDFTVLRNQVATVTINGARLHLAGVDDLGRDWARGVRSHPGLTTILSQLPPDEPVILLSHRPDLFCQAAAAGIGLVLSGHTHGGQLALPAIGRRQLTLARFVTPYDRGLYRDGASYLYVNCGIGCTGQRIRLFTPREIAVFEIAAPAAEPSSGHRPPKPTA